jgi:hypothetical protein
MRVHKTEELSFPRFSIVGNTNYIVDSLCFITGLNIRYLTAILNSQYACQYFVQNIAILDNGGMQMRQQYVENLPIPPITATNQQVVAAIEACVERILAAKQGDITADTRVDEATIDQLVCQLYDLTPAEVALIEAAQPGGALVASDDGEDE